MHNTQMGAPLFKGTALILRSGVDKYCARADPGNHRKRPQSVGPGCGGATGKASSGTGSVGGGEES